MPVRRPASIVTAALLAAALAGCAAAPLDPVAEQLDARTGTTVTALHRPAEFLAAEGRGGATDPYAYAAPFETNEMGQRRTFLWASTPEPQADTAGPPTVTCDGRALGLDPVTEGAQALALSRDPYPPPTAWNARWLFALDDASLGCLATAKEVQLVVRTHDGTVRRYIAVEGAPALFAVFRERIRAAQ